MNKKKEEKGVLNYNGRMTNNTYDDFSQDYDRFVNWDSRLQAEIPFVEARLSELEFDLKIKNHLFWMQPAGRVCMPLSWHGAATALPART